MLGGELFVCMLLTPLKRDLAGVFLISFAILLFEVVSSRILSAIFLKHYAYVVVALAMLGLAVGGLRMCLEARRKQVTTERSLAASAFALSWAALAALGSYVYLATYDLNIVNLVRLSQADILLLGAIVLSVSLFVAAPFYFGGLIIARATVRYASRAGILYAADLAGAAGGAVSAVFILPALGAAGAIIIVASAAFLGAVFFSYGDFFLNRKKILASILVILVIVIVDYSLPLFEFRRREGRPLFAGWNSFSYITVFDAFLEDGVSWRKAGEPFQIPEKAILIDNDALTPLIPVKDDIHKVSSVARSLAAAPFAVKTGKVLVIGSGGGADVLAAIQYPGNRVTAVEINPLIARLVTKEYATLIGNLFTQPEVELVVSEARSYLHNTDRRFDLIVATLIDTWAASMQGSLSTVENYLYTKEAFDDYFAHLEDEGIVAMTRWRPEEPAMMALLARVLGSDRLDSQVQIVRYGGHASFLIKNQPWNSDERAALETFGAENGYSIESVGKPPHPVEIARAATDDRPFFFQSHEPLFLFSILANKKAATQILVITFWFIVAAVGLLMLVARRSIFHRFSTRSKALLAYFFLIGVSFFIAEVVIIQRLTLFVGNPMVTLALIVGGFLFYAGTGSALADRLSYKPRTIIVLALAPAILIISEITIIPALYNILDLAEISRIAASLLLIAPIGVTMGMLYPFAVRLTSERAPDLVGWGWMINSAASVLGSILALVLSLEFGFRRAIMSAVFMYILALILMWYVLRKERAQ